MMIAEIDPPFGTYALPAPQEAWRRKADAYPNTRVGRWRISHARKKALTGRDEPFDVLIQQDVKARLYPSHNRCEKRVFAGGHIWDHSERLSLKAAIESATETPFIFLDAGANVGLYSLFVNAYARAAKKPARIIAIEPGVETAIRLKDNVAANQAGIEVLQVAVSDTTGTGYLEGDDTNRGEAKLLDASNVGEAVRVDTLHNIVGTLGLSRIDALKLDIEGHDFKALSAFFKDARPSLHPLLLILETGPDPVSPLIELACANGYALTERTKLNAILKKG